MNRLGGPPLNASNWKQDQEFRDKVEKGVAERRGVYDHSLLRDRGGIMPWSAIGIGSPFGVPAVSAQERAAIELARRLQMEVAMRMLTPSIMREQAADVFRQSLQSGIQEGLQANLGAASNPPPPAVVPLPEGRRELDLEDAGEIRAPAVVAREIEL